MRNWLYTEHRPLTKREAWEDMLMLANFADSKVLIKGQLFECKRGQLLYSYETYAEKFLWSVGQVRNFFKMLRNDGMIITEKLKYTTQLTICNYDVCQGEQHTEQHTDDGLSDTLSDTLTTGSKQQDKNDNNNSSSEQKIPTPDSGENINDPAVPIDLFTEQEKTGDVPLPMTYACLTTGAKNFPSTPLVAPYVSVNPTNS
jgi:Putative primosome component and related proteins